MKRPAQLVLVCPFCRGMTDWHCHYAAGAPRATCDLRRCRSKECLSYGRARDASRWVRPAVH